MGDARDIWYWPVPGWTGISWDWGDDGGAHRAIDIPATAGTAIVAPVDMHITSVGYDEDGYGNYIRATATVAGEVITFIFGHLLDGSTLVQAGEDVAAGEDIGGVGTTGHSTGNHLHFETRKGSTPVNPWTWLFNAIGGVAHDIGDIINPPDAGSSTNPGSSGTSITGTIRGINDLAEWIAELDFKKIFGSVSLVLVGIVVIAVAVIGLIGKSTMAAAGDVIAETAKGYIKPANNEGG